MKKEIKEMNMKELGGFICESLMAKDIHVVLSGGSCVEMYELGFREYNRYFVHNDTELFIEFPSGPLGVGDAPVEEIAEIDTEAGVLRLLTPTDCIKDRLAAFYHWDDEQCLQQAIWVAQQNKFDLESVKKWSLSEGAEGKFSLFLISVKSESNR